MNETMNFRRCGALIFLSMVATAVSAQQDLSIETVANRVRPALDPLGIRLGSFVVSPSLAAEVHYNDNIFADPRVTVEDFIYFANPALALESDWSNHSLGFEVEAELGRYDDNDAEEYDDYSFEAFSRLDISRASYVSADYLYSNNHEERTSAENTAGTELTIYEVSEASLTYFRQPNRLFLRLDSEIRETDFEDTRVGDRIINNDDRNRRGTRHSVRFGYEFAGGAMVYLRGSANSLKYEQKIDDDGFERSSDGYEVVLGFSRAISGISSLSAFAGFLSQDIDDPRFETVDGVSFGADITWNITNLMTLNVEASREVEPTSIFGASSISATSYGLSIDYELLRSLILSADVELARDNYEGLDREDEIVRSGFGIKFMLNRTLHLFVGFDYQERDARPAEFAEDAYTINSGFVRIQGQM